MSHLYNRANQLQVYVVFVKIDAFFIICFVLHYGLVDVHFIEPEFGVTMSVIPALTIVMVLGVYFVRREYKPPMAFVIVRPIYILDLALTTESHLLTKINQVCHLAMIAYIISRIVVLFGDGFLAATPTKDMTLLFAFASLFLTILSVLFGIRCFMNFGHGLKPILAGKAHSVRTTYDFHTMSRHSPKLDSVSHRRLSLA